MTWVMRPARWPWMILTEGADISTMEIRYAPQTTKMYNPSICETLGITVPEDYVAVSEE